MNRYENDADEFFREAAKAEGKPLWQWYRDNGIVPPEALDRRDRGDVPITGLDLERLGSCDITGAPIP